MAAIGQGADQGNRLSEIMDLEDAKKEDCCFLTDRIVSIATLWITTAASSFIALGTAFGCCFLLGRFNSITILAKMTPQAMKIFSIVLNSLISAFPIGINITTAVIINAVRYENQYEDNLDESPSSMRKIILVFSIISSFAILSNCIVNNILIGRFSHMIMAAKKIGMINTTVLISIISNGLFSILGSFLPVGSAISATILIALSRRRCSGQQLHQFPPPAPPPDYFPDNQHGGRPRQQVLFLIPSLPQGAPQNHVGNQQVPTGPPHGGLSVSTGPQQTGPN